MNEEKAIDWEGLVLKVASYKGTMKEFCKENNFTIIEKKYSVQIKLSFMKFH